MRTYKFGQFSLELNNRRLSARHEVIPLTPKMFDLLVFLLENANRSISKDELLKHVWPGSFVSEENLSRHISMLRKALREGEPEQKFIETVPKFGYRFTCPVTVSEGAATPAHVGSATAREQLVAWPTELSLAVETASAAKLPSITNHPILPTQPGQLSQSAMLPLPLAARWLTPRGMLLTLLALSASLAIGTYAWTQRKPSSALVPPRLAPLTSLLNRENNPAYAPDDRQIAFTWDGEGGDNYDIYLRMVSGGNLLRLTTHPAADISPAWSPDGQTVAFMRLTNEGASIYQVSALGGPERELLTGIRTSDRERALIKRLAWAPDGKTIFFSGSMLDNNSPKLHLYALQLDNLQYRQLTNHQQSDRNPAISPDGKTLAFVRGFDEIFAMPVSGGEPKQLTFDSKIIFGLAWTPDSRALFFSSPRTGESTLWKINAQGGTPIALIPGGDQVGDFALAHQSDQLIYAQNLTDTNIWQMATDGANNAAPTLFIASTRNDNAPQFSPDGNRIAFISNRTGNFELWVCDQTGQNPVQLTSINGPQIGNPRWSPDGKRLAYNSTSHKDQQDIYVISAAGGPPQRVTTDEANPETMPAWSYDGQWLYYRANNQIWKQPSGGGAAIQVTQQGGNESFASPDGQYLYYSKPTQPGIWRLPSAGGPEEQILPYGDSSHWTMSPQGIYLLHAKPSEQTVTLEFYQFTTAKTSLIATLNKKVMQGLTYVPAHHRLLWSQIDRYESDLLLIENYR